MYQEKINVVVSSKYSEIGKQFVEGFLNTTQNFENIKLYYISKDHPDHILSPKIVYIHSDLFGSVVINPLIKQMLKDGIKYFGWFNDDMWLFEGWLEDIIDKLNKGYLLVCAGTVDTDDYEHFIKVVEQTKNENGIDEYLPLATAVMDIRLFRKIGLLDERYVGAGDDMDIYWRLLINKIPHCSSRKITAAHWVGTSTYRDTIKPNFKKFNANFKKMKNLFIEKHGYEAYHNTAKKMKDTYKPYFAKLRYLKNEQH